ncbi:MAG TPA: ribonucleoside-diphosphate reductase subunit alpha [Actinomycetota bacterium]|nr:ribonucleoside-diphosphate reductase subunit alpha [Actinomycetota bacterium]
MLIKKSHGVTEPFQVAKLQKILDAAATGLEDVDTYSVLVDVEVGIYDGVTSKELGELVLSSCLQHVQDDPGYSLLAARVLLFDLYKRALGKHSFDDIKAAHVARFADYIKEGAERGLISQRLTEGFDYQRLAEALEPSRDLEFRFNGLFALKERYLVQDLETSELFDTPQFFWMRVAMGVSINEDDPTARAIDFYHAMSQMHYIPSTPTLFNAGTPSSQLSSCFLMEAQDSMEAIGKSLTDIMQLAKYAGGIGASITKLRATGSVIRSINGRSSGPIPFIKMMDAVISGIDQGGRRRGTLAVYCEPWHYDIERFLDLKQRAGDESQRVHTLNTVLFLNDEFMSRVENDEPWTLFDPNEVRDLPELYGMEFSDRYKFYVEEARAGRIRTYRTVKARMLFHKMLKSLVETSHPWLTFKDSGNVRCPIKNVGMVHSSNLCTEIFLPTDERNVAVCNLASVVLPRHLDDNNEIDWDSLAAASRLAVRHLDDVIDANFYAIPEAERANHNSRPVGLGFMGWSDLLERMGLAFESAEALDLLDRIVEFISFHAIAASADLARERGSFPAFEGSDWSQGMVPIDTLQLLDKERPEPVDVNRETRLDWESLRAKVAGGMRNGTVMAVAPTATISLIAGTSQSIEPPFSTVYARNNIAGKFLEVNENLVAKLKDLDLWDDVCEEILLRQGELRTIEEIPAEVKEVFKTAYEISPSTLVRQGSVVQKWVDQGASRNIYLTTKNAEALSKVYLEAWKTGLKSTYYAFSQPGSRSEATYAYDESRPKAHMERGGGISNGSPAGNGAAAPAAGTKTTVPASSGGVAAVLTATDITLEAQACSIDNPECESCQ